MSTEKLETLFVAQKGERLDKFLASAYPQFSRTYFQQLIAEGCILLNGERVKKRTCPEVGDEIEICFQATPEMSLEPEAIPLDILFEDEHLLAINKPVGMVVHPAPGHASGTFANALLAHCKDALPSSDPLRPGIVHRLDKGTSGVLLAAKTAQAHRRLIEQFAARAIDKLYLALCCGCPPNGPCDAPIGRHPVHRKEMAVVPDGKEALTTFQVLACNDRYSLVLARPKTGRTHQIRVHLQHLGAPVYGDALYGTAADVGRPLLHAYRLTLTHPITATPLTFTAPIPDDLKSWIQALCDNSALV